MRDYWLISDTHFGHQNIIKYCNRPFSSTEEMDEHMVERWNSVVKDGDNVYHLGDVYMGGSRGYIDTLLGRLKGRKRLLLGNHDNGRDQLLQRHFKKIDLWRKMGEWGLLLTHVPVHPSTLGESRFDTGDDDTRFINVHGHIHTNSSPEGPYRCVCVEQINYTPINIDELRIR